MKFVPRNLDCHKNTSLSTFSVLLIIPESKGTLFCDSTKAGEFPQFRQKPLRIGLFWRVGGNPGSNFISNWFSHESIVEWKTPVWTGGNQECPSYNWKEKSTILLIFFYLHSRFENDLLFCVTFKITPINNLVKLIVILLNLQV